MTHKNTLSLFSFFIVFLLIFTSFLMINIEAKTDKHLAYGGGVPMLAYPSYEHIVTDNNNIACAFIGYNGDSTFVQFIYSEDSGFWWTIKTIRQTINETLLVAIARDINFNIHAIYQEKNATTYSLFYKFFQWSDKTWYLSPKANVKSPKENMGFLVSSATAKVPFGGDIKVDLDGNVHMIFGQQDHDNKAENIYYRYSATLNTWDLTIALDNEVTTQGIYAYHSIAFDSESNIYCTYGKKQDGHYSKTEYWDSWFIKSTDGGDSWSSESLILNQTYPNTVVSSKLIIDTSNILHHVYYANYSSIDGSFNYLVGYAKSTNYGSTWLFANITDRNKHHAYPSITMDSNNVIYFTYSKQNSFGVDYTGIYGKKYDIGVLGYEVKIIDKNGSHQQRLNLVFSNTYSQYADSGVIGIYSDWSVANVDMRYLEMDYNEFIGAPSLFKWDIIPDKDIYLVYDTVTLRQTTYTQNAFWNRIVDANNIFVFYPEFYHTIGVKDTVFTIPTGFLNGTWIIETYVTDNYFFPPDWGNDTHYDTPFEVRSSQLDYYISSSKYYVTVPDTIDITFSAKTGESYILQLIHENYGILSNVSIPQIGVTQDYLYSNAFTLFDAGIYRVKLLNATNDFVFAITDGIRASIYPQIPTYDTNLKKSYPVNEEQIIIIFSDAIKQYKYEFYNLYGELIKTNVYSGMKNPVKITFYTVGTGYYLFVYDVDGTKYDTNVYYKEFDVYDPKDDPIISIIMDIPTWAKAIVGVVVVLGFIFVPFVLSQYITGSHKLDVPPVIYAICGGIGVTLCTLLGLFGWEIMFFICVISAISLILSYVWQQRGD